MEAEIARVQKLYDMAVEFIVNYSFQLLGAILVLLMGLWAAKKTANLVFGLLTRHNIDVTLSKFLSNLTRIVIVVMFAIISLGKIGISVTPFVAAIGAASLGAGLAFQGLLSNYGAGFTIIITQPFKIGDTLSVQGVTGVVKDIHLGMTILTDEDDQEITIPNRHIVGEILTNSSTSSLVAGSVGIAYSSDIDTTLALVRNSIVESGLAIEDKPPVVGIEEFGDSAISIAYRCWVPTQSYYQDKFAINALVFKTLNQKGVVIPFPQAEVRMLES